MDNHYHLLIETPQANLSKGMRQLNGVYTQRYNRAHDLSGQHTMAAIAQHFGVHYTTVSRLVSAYEDAVKG